MMSSRRLYQIIDVREPNELQTASLTGSDIINLPLSRANEWTGDIKSGKILDKSKPTICMCKIGMRSMKMAMFLTQQAGFEEVYNVEGGINEYGRCTTQNHPSHALELSFYNNLL